MGSVRGAETEMDTWLKSHIPTMDTTECESPWTLIIQKAGLFPPSKIHTKTRYNALKALDVYEQDQQGEPALGVHGDYCKKKH